ncbi:MAG: helix-turn-helix domain-containing protein [Chitinispirillaceae bacterium]
MRRKQITIDISLVLFFLTILLLNKISRGQDSLSLPVQAGSTSVNEAKDSLVQDSSLIDSAVMLDSSVESSADSVFEPDSSVEAGADSLTVPDSSDESSAESKDVQDSSALTAAVADTQESSVERESTGILKTAAPPSVQERSIEKEVSGENTSEASSGSFLNWFRSHLFHLVFIAVCLTVILYTVFFFLKKMRDANARRFLTTTRLSVFDKMVQRTCRYIESNFADQQLTVNSICRDLVTGEAYLEALFEKELGISISEFIDQVRVNHLRELLGENSETEPAQLIHQCGWADMETAQKTFSSVTGIGLEEFRESCAEKSAV